MLAGPSLCGNHIVQGNREGMESMKVIVSPGSPASLQGYRAVPGMRPLGRTNSWADRILRLRLRRQRDSAWKAEERGRDGAKKTPSSARRGSADGKIALGLQSQTSVRQAARKAAGAFPQAGPPWWDALAASPSARESSEIGR